MISAAQFANGVSTFLAENVLNKVEPWKQFAGGMAIGMFTAKSEDMVRQIAEMPGISMLGVVHDNGEIDADALFDAAEKQFSRQPKLEVDIPLLGRFAFDSADLYELRRAVMGR